MSFSFVPALISFYPSFQVNTMPQALATGTPVLPVGNIALLHHSGLQGPFAALCFVHKACTFHVHHNFAVWVVRHNFKSR